MKKIHFFQIWVLALLLGLVIKVSPVFAIGMITEPIVVDNMLRGGEISKVVTVFNPQKTEVVYVFGSEGGVKGWVTFFEKGKPDTPVTKVVVPPTSYYDVIAKIKVPQDTPNGEYKGEIFVKQEAVSNAQEQGSSVAIAQMISREVKIKVTDTEIVKLGTALIPESYDVSSGQPLKIKIIYENLGNISVRPSFQLKILDGSGEKTVYNAIYPYPDSEESVKPGERKTMPMQEWPTTGQPTGSYVAEAYTMVGNATLEKNNFHFNLANQRDGNGKVLGAFVTKIGGGKTQLGWAIIVGVVAVLVLFALFLVSRKRKTLY